MNKQVGKAKHEVRKQTFSGESNSMDWIALICDLVMLGIFVWAQLWYHMNMLFLIIPLLLLGIYLISFCVFVEEYRFTEEALEIRHKMRKTVTVSYDSVFNYESGARDSFINIFQSNRVKIYHECKGKKSVTVCAPRDVASFVEVLRWNCPEFHDDSKEKSNLDVFFQK